MQLIRDESIESGRSEVYGLASNMYQVIFLKYSKEREGTGREFDCSKEIRICEKREGVRWSEEGIRIVRGIFEQIN